MRLITSRRREAVGTPPTDRLRPVATVSPVAGPTTEIAAEALPLSTLNCSSEPDDWPFLQPCGAGAPDGRTATVDSGAALVFVLAAATLLPFSVSAALAMRIWCRRIMRLRACSAFLRRWRAWY